MRFKFYLIAFILYTTSMITSLFFAIPAFKQMDFPVGTFTRQLSFDEVKLQRWLQIMQEGNRIHLITIQHRFDDWFALSFGLVFFSLGLLLSERFSIQSFKIFGSLGLLGGILDLVENRIFLNMAADIQAIDSTSAIIFSTVNFFKWGLYAIGIIGIIYVWLRKRS
ncbi:MAG: hypothetical protein GW938_14485 [Leptospira sp.]|nr:hypothetical protein [Leptospira sp.]NCS93779.1 hypothetical protein [Leptospira sp.]